MKRTKTSCVESCHRKRYWCNESSDFQDSKDDVEDDDGSNSVNDDKNDSGAQEAQSDCYRPTVIFPDFSLFFLTF
jgi:hypothetical protein